MQAVAELKDAAAVEKFLSGSEVAVLAFVEPKSKEAATLEAVADALRSGEDPSCFLAVWDLLDLWML